MARYDGMMSSAIRVGAAAVLLGLLCGGCGEDGSYRIVVRFDDDAVAARTDRIELALLPSCEDVTGGQPPQDGARRLEAMPGEPPPTFGAVDEGRYGLYGRAFEEAACAVIAAGCQPVEIERGGGGELVVVLTGVAGLGCPGGSTCEGGRCAPLPDPNDERWIDAECTFEGGSCGDRFTGIPGRCRESPTGLRCCAGCYENDTLRCEPGDTVEACGWSGESCDDCFGDEICQAIDIIRQCRDTT